MNKSKQSIRQKLVKKLVKIAKLCMKDISFQHGGWLYFIVRMVVNVFWLWLSFLFIWNWYNFLYVDFYMTNKLDDFRNILWVFSLLFLLVRIFLSIDFKETRKYYNELTVKK